MNTLVVRPEEVCFPDRCARCGASAARATTAELWRGVDLLVFAWGRSCEIEVPACDRCWARRLWGRALWMVGLLGALVGVIVAAGFASRGAPAVIAPLALLLVPALLFLRRYERPLYDRFFAAVAIRGWDERAGTVELAFRERRLRDDVAVLSGLEAPPPPTSQGYRDAVVHEPPPAWRGASPRGVAWWIPVVLGIGFVVAGFAEWAQFDKAERLGRAVRDHVLVILLYDLGGKYTVLGFFVVFGLGFAAVGIIARARGKKKLHVGERFF